VPDWQAIERNYAAATRERLGELMGTTPPFAGGRLVLWHGPPGTGKTNALRALAYEWRQHAMLHYVTDPQELLTQPGYMQSLLLDQADRRWRLIVLEDAVDLVAPDAGSGLSRLLNLTDGFVGQGLKVLVLITGNDPLDGLHPAVSRPGRCAAEVAFERFDADAAAEWLAGRGANAEVGPASLAELYGVLDGRAAPAEKRPVGFLSA
jgi:SpoVK/Ycf46/Vps4 family AAA+-type ATPase